MGLDDYTTDSGVLVLRARDRETFDASRYGTLLGEGELGLTQDDLAAMRTDGLFPLKPRAEAAPGLGAGDWPEDLQETLSLLTDPRGEKVLGSRRLTVRAGPGLVDAQISKLCRTADLDLIRRLGRRGTSFSAWIPRNEDPLEYAKKVRDRLGDAVEHVRPEFLHRYRPAWQPAGPLYKQQWQWYEPPANASSTEAYDKLPINIESAWETAKGHKVRIAVIDRGFDVGHPDLTHAVLDRSGHWPSAGNASFQAGRAYVKASNAWHGTICAGMAAAHPVEGRGIVGAAPEADLVLLSVDEWTSPENFSRAVRYVRGHSIQRPLGCVGWILSWFFPLSTKVDYCEAEIISIANDPFMNKEGYEVLVEALDELADVGQEAGLPVFAPAGNDPSQDISQDKVLAHPQVIVVSRVDPDGKWVPSSKGDWVDVAAPGWAVCSTVPRSSGKQNDIDVDSGTSYAAPCAAGVAALMLSVRPWLSTSTIRKILRDTCEPVTGASTMSGPDRARAFGAGRINAGNALARALEEE